MGRREGHSLQFLAQLDTGCTLFFPWGAKAAEDHDKPIHLTSFKSSSPACLHSRNGTGSVCCLTRGLLLVTLLLRGCLWGQPRCSSIWGVSVIPLAEKWCFRVKPPGRQEALKALELGKVCPRVHQRSSALPIQGQDWAAMAKAGCQEAVKAKAFLDQLGESSRTRQPDSALLGPVRHWGRRCRKHRNFQRVRLVPGIPLLQRKTLPVPLGPHWL